VCRDEAHGGTPRALRADIAFPQVQQEAVSPRGGQQLSPRTGKLGGSKAGEQERRLTAIVHRHIKELLSIVAGSATSTRISPAQFEALSIVLMPPFNSGPRPALCPATRLQRACVRTRTRARMRVRARAAGACQVALGTHNQLQSLLTALARSRRKPRPAAQPSAPVVA